MYLIPMRIVMWSAGTSYFVARGTDKKKVVRNILTHPCLVAVYIGMAIMLLHIPLPTLLTSTITGIGNCNTAITMFIIGTILVDVPLLTIVNPTTLWISALRLVLLPAAAWGISLALGLEPVATGVAVIMTGMPAGSTAAIFAARYGSDASVCHQMRGTQHPAVHAHHSGVVLSHRRLTKGGRIWYPVPRNKGNEVSLVLRD